MSRRTGGQRTGVASVELAVSLPLLLFLLLGTWEVGRLLNAKMVLENAAAVGSRQASAGTYTNAQIQQTVLNYIKFAGLSTAHASVTVRDLTNTSTDVSQATQMDRLQVIVTLPFSDVRYVAARLVTSSATQVSATATCNSAKADPYPTSITVPNAW
jgi:Flp pilus assembly protein TadG